MIKFDKRFALNIVIAAVVYLFDLCENIAIAWTK